MTVPLRFTDAESARDALTFAGRAGTVGDGTVRLQAEEGVLRMTAAALAPRGLLDATPTILGMRVLRVDPELCCDLSVALLAPGDTPTELILPDTAVAPSWAGVSAPRSGWSAVGEVASTDLADRAHWGISAVARALPDAPGEDAVRAVRSRIWGEPDEALDGLLRGVAFAAEGFGFLAGAESARVLRHGRWTRLSLSRGHVLCHGPAATGLTAVRTTGRV